MALSPAGQRALTAGLLMLVIAVVAFYFSMNAVELTDEELAQRVADSDPTWESYQEDVKEQIGANPVAEWQGELVAVEHENEVVHVRFRLKGAWADRDTAMPVLLRDPRGRVYQSTTATHDNGAVVYEFSEVDGSMPYVEVLFPRGERQVTLADGNWKAAATE